MSVPAHIRWLQKTAPALPFRCWQNWSGENLFLPFYHLVSDENPAHVSHLYPVRSIRQFEADLAFLLRYFEPVPLEQLFACVFENKAFTKPVFHLTFDDGLRECFDVIRPILLRKGIPATFFLNSAFVDNKDLMFRYKASLVANAGMPKALDCDYKTRDQLDEMGKICGLDFQVFLKQQQPYLTSSHIQQMLGEGFTFGAHSVDHPLFSAMTIEEQQQQVARSLDFIQKTFSIDYQVFAFPFTDEGTYPDLLFPREKKALSFGGAGLKKDAAPYHLQRFAMERTALAAEIIVSTEFAYTCIRKLTGRHLVKR